jgi:hypothetical protein
MTGARDLLEKLLNNTIDEVEDVANLKLPEGLHQNPYEAIRYFYPEIGFQNGEFAVYASRAAGKGRPSLLQELLLGIPIMIDITDAKPFSDEYGMTPVELKTEINENRLLPVTNASNPLEWSDDFIEYIKPILETNKLQFAHHRTTAFQAWLIGESYEGLEKEGQKIFSEFFTPNNNDDWDELIAALRVGRYKNPREVAVRVVAGRYRSICAFKPSLRSILPYNFRILRSQGYSSSQLAALLNGIKNIVSGPITAGRGGIFRASPEQYKEIRGAIDLSKKNPEFSNAHPHSVPFDLATKELIPFFEKSNILPVPQNLEYRRFLELIQHNHWNQFASNISKLLRSLAQEPIEDFNIRWGEVVRGYREFHQQASKAERVSRVVLYGIEYLVPVAGLAARKSLEWNDSRFPKNIDKTKHGRMLGQIVCNAQRNSWPPQWLPDAE